jgi:hypothetical protein
MSIATLLNIPNFQQPASLSEFSFNNQAEHQKIVQSIYNKRQILLTLYPLDPIPLSDWRGWFRLHQQAHDDLEAVLGIESFDLSGFDFNNRDEVEAWIRLHFDTHQSAAAVLGLN